MIDNDRNERQGCVPPTTFSGCLDDYGRFPEIGKSMKMSVFAVVQGCCHQVSQPSPSIKVTHSINQSHSKSVTQIQSSSRTSLLVFFLFSFFPFFFPFSLLFSNPLHPHTRTPTNQPNHNHQPLLGASGHPLRK